MPDEERKSPPSLLDAGADKLGSIINRKDVSVLAGALTGYLLTKGESSSTRALLTGAAAVAGGDLYQHGLDARTSARKERHAAAEAETYRRQQAEAKQRATEQNNLATRLISLQNNQATQELRRAEGQEKRNQNAAVNEFAVSTADRADRQLSINAKNSQSLREHRGVESEGIKSMIGHREVLEEQAAERLQISRDRLDLDKRQADTKSEKTTGANKYTVPQLKVIALRKSILDVGERLSAQYGNFVVTDKLIANVENQLLSHSFLDRLPPDVLGRSEDGFSLNFKGTHVADEINKVFINTLKNQPYGIDLTTEGLAAAYTEFGEGYLESAPLVEMFSQFDSPESRMEYFAKRRNEPYSFAPPTAEAAIEYGNGGSPNVQQATAQTVQSLNEVAAPGPELIGPPPPIQIGGKTYQATTMPYPDPPGSFIVIMNNVVLKRNDDQTKAQVFSSLIDAEAAAYKLTKDIAEEFGNEGSPIVPSQ